MKPKSKTILFLLLVAVIVLLLLRSCPKKIDDPKTNPAPIKTPAPAAAKPKKVIDERHRIVDALLKKNRLKIGQCLLSSDRPKVARGQLTLTFDPTGRLARVNLAPDLGVACGTCLTQLMSAWTLPVATDLAPLTVSKKINLNIR